MKKNKLLKFFTSAIAFMVAIAIIIKLAGPNILKQYISYGIGDCKSIPILCVQPEEKIFIPQVDSSIELVPQTFPKVALSVPRGFTLVQELIKKTYYKRKNPNNKAVIYMLTQKPGDFIRLYPDVKKQGVTSNRQFIRRVMYASLNKLDNLTDAFFIVMKSIFIPDIGNQKISRMIQFEFDNKSGYINYTMARPDNYFDCNVLDSKDNFFKLYIKDVGSRLDLNTVFAIISTLKPVKYD